MFHPTTSLLLLLSWLVLALAVPKLIAPLPIWLEKAWAAFGIILVAFALWVVFRGPSLTS